MTYFLLLGFTAFSALLPRGNVFRYILFFVPTILIVGLRYEMAFDWHVYKDQFNFFETLPLTQFFTNFADITFRYPHEPLFQFLAFVAAKTLPSYEIFQLLVYLFFMYSFNRLNRAIGGQNFILSLLIVHLFLLFSLEFSTIRQVIAISFFNLGMAHSFEKQRGRALWFFACAPFIQASSLIYLITFWAASAGRRYIKVVGIFGIGGIFLFQFIPPESLAALFPGILGVKLQYYLLLKTYEPNILEQSFFAVFFFGLLVFSFAQVDIRDDVRSKVKLVIIMLCFGALASFEITTFRNRLLYEIVILASILILTPGLRLRRSCYMAILGMGSVFFIASLNKDNSFTYLPYQNYVVFELMGKESNGLQRLDELWWLIGR